MNGSCSQEFFIHVSREPAQVLGKGLVTCLGLAVALVLASWPHLDRLQMLEKWVTEMLEKWVTEFRANFSLIPFLLLPISFKFVNHILHNRHMFNSVALDFGFLEPRIEVDRDWLGLVCTLSLRLGTRHGDLREIFAKTLFSIVNLTLVPV